MLDNSSQICRPQSTSILQTFIINQINFTVATPPPIPQSTTYMDTPPFPLDII